MSKQVRLLVEVDGETWVSFEGEVESIQIDRSNPLYETGEHPDYKTYRPTGVRHIDIEYKPVRAEATT